MTRTMLLGGPLHDNQVMQDQGGDQDQVQVHETPLAAAAQRIPGPNASLTEMLSDRRAWIDGTITPLLFLGTNAIWGLQRAAIVGAAWGVLVAIYRGIRGQKVSYAIGGLVGLGVAILISLKTGRASTFFLPSVVTGTVSGIAGLVSVAVGRPASALLLRIVENKPKAWYENSRVKATHMLVTSAWSLFIIIRSGIRLYLIRADSEWGLGVTAVALGAPATALLFLGTWAFVRTRLKGVSITP